MCEDASRRPARAGRATIVLAEPRGVVCTAIRRVLEVEQEFDVVAEATDLEAAVRKVLGYKPDVALVDQDLGWGSLPDALPRFASASPQTGVVLLADDNDLRLVRSFMRAGGRGLVIKQSPSSHLTDAVHAVADGRRYLDPELGAQLAIDEQLSPHADGLTEREVEVMTLVALGYATREIADRLMLSVRTVEAHRAQLKRKIHTRSRAGVIAYARACHLV